MKVGIGVLVCIAWLLPLSAAHAATENMLFGTGEDVHAIQDVALKGPGGEPLVLAYKTTTRYFIGGLYVRDDGYVLRPQSDTGRYLQLPKGDELSRFQQQGLLPNPLPPYKLGAFDYANGYSLWMIVALTLLVIVLPPIVRSRRRLRSA